MVPKILGVRLRFLVLGLVIATGAAAHEPAPVSLAELSRLLAADPDNVSLLLARADLRRVAGDLEGALADLAHVTRVAPDDATLPLVRATVELDAGRAEAARHLLDARLIAHPGDAKAHRLRARAAIGLGDSRAAIADLSAAIRLSDRPHPDLFMERARLQLAKGDAIGARDGLAEGRARLGPVASLELAAFDLESTRRPSSVRVDGRHAGTSDPRAGGGVAGVPQQAGTMARAAGSVLALPRNSVWKYDTTGTDLGTAWREPSFDDSAWPSGPGILGYGETYVATPVPYGPDPLNRYPTTYFRATFVVDDPIAEIQSLTLESNFDDGFLLYLNGVEATRRQMPAGEVGYPTLTSGHEGGNYETVDLSAAIPLLVPGPNVIAVEVHQTSASSSDLVWDAELTYSDVPLLTRGPYLQVGTQDSMTIRWRTNSPATSRVQYGSSPADLTHEFSDATLTTEHEVRIGGLLPSTRYYYSVGTGTEVLAGDSSFTFRTAPVPGQAAAVRLWVIGDSGATTSAARGVRDAYAAWTGTRATDLWLMLGDNAYTTGTDAEYQQAVFDQYPLMLRQSVVWPTRGNHDVIHAGPNDDYYEIFTLPASGEAEGLPSGTEAFYSFDWGNVHFICLDSEGSDRSPGSAMLSWLAADLAANRRPWVIAYWHHPPYSKGSHDSDNPGDSSGRMRDMRQNVLPILEAGGVDLVLTGHSHSYERSFLLNGHYGVSSTLSPSMVVNGGDGRPGGGGAYRKLPVAGHPNAGAVYAVAGSSSQTGGGPLNHPVMIASLNVAGSMVIDIQRNILEARFLTSTGTVADSFAITKLTFAEAELDPNGPRGPAIGPALPNPFAGDLRVRYALEEAGRVRLTVVDASGRRVATLVDGWCPAGANETRWNGRDTRGRSLPNGVYLAVLEAAGQRMTRKVALVR